MYLTKNSLPLADLHVHLRGTITPSMAIKLAKKNNINLPRNLIKNDRYHWSDFGSFLNTYSAIGEVVCTDDDVYSIAKDYLLRCSELGVVYVEFMITPNHGINSALPLDVLAESVARAAEECGEATGIICNIIVTALRHREPNEALAIVHEIEKCSAPNIVGFGLTGNEFKNEVSDFAPAFQRAKALGLKTTAHVGEWLGPEAVISAVDTLQLDRVGHGIRVVESPDILGEMAARNIGFEVCMSSNIQLSAVQEDQEHPIVELIQAGCRVSICTDDPAYFDTTPLKEVEVGLRSGLFDKQQYTKIFADTVSMSFCAEAEKSQLRRGNIRP